MTPLPYDYEVEYLEGSGTQYIDTGFVPDDTCGMKLRFYSPVDVNIKAIAGTGNSGTNNRWFVAAYSTGTLRYGWNTASSGISYVLAETWVEVEHNYLNSRSLAIDGVDKGLSYPTLNTTAMTAYIFAQNVHNAPRSIFGGRISSVRFTKGSQVVMDFIPVVKNGIGCMYDKVSGRLFGNAGTGNFIVGPRKSN